MIIPTKKIKDLSPQVEDEIEFLIPDLSDYVNPLLLIHYMKQKYGEYELLPSCFESLEFLSYIRNCFEVNRYKYEKLKLTATTSYDIFSPYNITQQIASGDAMSKSNSIQGNTSASQFETSIEDLSPKLTNQATTDSVTDSAYYDNDQSLQFKDDRVTANLNNKTSTHEEYHSRKGNIGNHTYADIIGKERNIALFSLYDIIAVDFIDATCFKIFSVVDGKNILDLI